MSTWKIVQLSEVASVFNGKTPSKEEQRVQGHSVLKIKDVNELGEYRGKFDSFVEPDLAKKFEAKLVQEGDTLILNAAHNSDYVASKIYHAQPPTFGALATGEWLIVRPDKRRLNARFVHYWVNTPRTRRELRNLVNGIHLYPKDVSRLRIPVPALEDQRRITEFLSKAQALREKRRAALGQLGTLIRSIFLDMFGDPLVNPKGWSLEKLGSIGTLDRGVSKHRPRNAPELLGGPYPLVQTGEIANCDGYVRHHHASYSDFGLQQSKMWPAGTLCITIAANIAKTGILTFDACFPDSVVGFRTTTPGTVEFVRIWLSFLQKSLEDNAPESAQKNINLAILRELTLPFPPLELQADFSRRVAAVETLRGHLIASLAGLDVLFGSLEHAAFSGNL